MARLRAPGGCPWDREQTFDTIKPFMLEETYEVLDAIDRRDWADSREELGDFMLQAVFFAQMAAEQKLFRIDDALDAINQKLVRRHPHVFGEESAETGRRCADASGTRSRPRRRRQKDEAPPDCSAACRARCRRWWKRSRSRRAPRASASTGRMPSRCSTSCTKNWPNSRRRAATRVAGRTGRRTGRSAVRAGEPGALRESGSRAGAAPDQRQVPQALRHIEAPPGASRASKPEDATIDEMEALWQEAKRSSPIEIRQLFQLEEFDDDRRAAEDHLGLRRHRTAAGALSGRGGESRRPGLRRLRRRPHGRLLLRHSGHQARRDALPAQPHAGRAAGVSQCADRPPAETAAARGRAGARHRPDRVDLRSAGTQERLLQYRAAGRHRAALRARTSTAPPPALCTAACPPIAASPNGGSIRRACDAILAGEPTGAGGQCRAHRVSGRYRGDPQQDDPRARARFRQAMRRAVPGRFRPRPRRHRLRAHRKPKARTCWSHGNETRTHHAAADPHAAGAFLRDQLSAAPTSATSSWWKSRAKASPAGAKSPPARIRSTTKSGPTPPG